VRQIGADPVVVPGWTPLLRELLAAGYRIVGREGVLVYLSPPGPPAPRAQLVPHAEATSAEAAIAAARAGRALDADHVLIEADVLPGGGEGDASGRVDLLDRSPGALHARVAVAKPTWLVLREPFYENWRATIDDRPAATFPAGGFLIGVLVDAGTHDVRLDYREPKLLPGALLALATAVVLPFVLRRTIAWSATVR
jgi:hypothetical protein